MIVVIERRIFMGYYADLPKMHESSEINAKLVEKVSLSHFNALIKNSIDLAEFFNAISFDEFMKITNSVNFNEFSALFPTTDSWFNFCGKIHNHNFREKMARDLGEKHFNKFTIQNAKQVAMFVDTVPTGLLGSNRKDTMMGLLSKISTANPTEINNEDRSAVTIKPI